MLAVLQREQLLYFMPISVAVGKNTSPKIIYILLTFRCWFVWTHIFPLVHTCNDRILFDKTLIEEIIYSCLVKINIPVNPNTFIFFLHLLTKQIKEFPRCRNTTSYSLHGRAAIMLCCYKGWKWRRAHPLNSAISQKGHFIPVRVESNLLILHQKSSSYFPEILPYTRACLPLWAMPWLVV